MAISILEPPAPSTGGNTNKLLLNQIIKVTGRLAHDFGNRLTGICGFAELSMKQVPDGSLAQRYLKEVCQSAQDAASWVQRLHVLSRGRPACVEPADLAEVLREEEKRLRPLLHGAAFEVSVPDGLPAVNIDREPLRQVIAELLDNAREALVGRGSITLAARAVSLAADDCRALMGSGEPGSCVDISITDTGTGLDAQVEHRVHADFFYSTKPRHHGLGLATVRAILHAYCGSMRFGPHPQKGTAVHVFVPVAPPLRLDQADDMPIVMQTTRRIP